MRAYIYIEESILNSVKLALAGRVNELLGEAELPIPPVEFGGGAIREAVHWQGAYRAVRQAGLKTAVITGVICFLGGLAVGSLITSIRAGY